MIARRLHLLAFGLILALAACTTNPPTQRLPEMTFRNLEPIQLNVGRIEIVSEYQPPGRAPHIEAEMPVAPDSAIRRWVQDRLRPVGREGTVRVVIRDAQATETPLATSNSLFTREQAARIDMSVDVAIQVLDDRQFVAAEATGRAARSRTTTEGIKLNARDQILYEMVEGMMKRFNDEIDPGIRSSLSSYIAY